MLLRQSTSRNLSVLMVDSSDHVTGKTGLTLTISASKDGGAFATITPTVTELATGWYSIALTTTHTNTLGDLAFHITGTGADPTDIVRQVVADLPGATVSSVTGAVGSVTGNVGGNVVGSVASVTAGVTVTTNNDKTGYSLSQTFPTNFSALAITGGGAVTAGTVSDKTGYALTSAYDAAKTAAQAGDAMTLTSGERTSVADAFLKRDMSAVTGEASRSPLNALRSLRNKMATDVPSAGQITVYKEDDSTSAWTATYSSVAASSANVITGVDPA